MDSVQGQESNAGSVSVCIPVLEDSRLVALLPACPDWPDLN